MFSLANLYIGALLTEHVLHNLEGNKIDILILNQWMAQRDMVPVVTKAMNGAYDLTRNSLQEIVYEGYDPSSTVEGKFIR